MTPQDLIAAEVARQDRMWGQAYERVDVSRGQLMNAAMAQLDALEARQVGLPDAFNVIPEQYPFGWSGFRDYGSDIANLVVAAAYLQQEIKRKLALGEPTTRTSRNLQTQPYDDKTKPFVIEP